MAGSLKTTFFNLVKYAANDITSWLTDFNGNMDKIDIAMNQNKTAAQTAQDGVENLEAEYESLLSVVNNHTTLIDANEKAIAANTASIAEIGDELNAVAIGNSVINKLNTSGVTKIEPLISAFSSCLRRIGNNVAGSVSIEISNGTMHSYDRIGTGLAEGNYLTDIVRIKGNPLNLPANVYSITFCLLMKKNGTTSGGITTLLTCIYLSESNYTAISVASSDEHAPSFDNAMIGVCAFI